MKTECPHGETLGSWCVECPGERAHRKCKDCGKLILRAGDIHTCSPQSTVVTQAIASTLIHKDIEQ